MSAAQGLDGVRAYQDLISRHLSRLEQLKWDSGIEPPLTEADCGELVLDLQAKALEKSKGPNEKAHYALVETCFRERFYSLLGTEFIDAPSFTQVWNLLDVVAILSDYELCEPSLIFWLVEELLDSQIIDGCRKVFDYLESRREQITAKHFYQKHLIILRSCNELLRRLSRAEDTVFCGRVFIFLFQSFPLGDMSSVNLRGLFHVENATIYDKDTKKSVDAIQPMEMSIDSAEKHSETGTPAPASTMKEEMPGPGKEVKTEDDQPPDLDALYPIFWAMQANFSNPTSLFRSENLLSFKEGLSATMECFEKVHSNVSASTDRLSEGRRSAKRKRSVSGSDFSSSVHTKYLTNRDLFDLEVHDIAFRRHILVQALIILDFLLSMTPPAKQKHFEKINRAVLYSFTLSEEDAAWASATKSSIASYLQQGNGNEGKFYYRMVDTVLSRDKNWVRWKADSCPSINRLPTPGKAHLEAQQRLKKLCTRYPLPPPPGAADLHFLSQNTSSLDSLRDRLSLSIPTPASFYNGIENDELDAEMGTEEDKKAANEAKDSKLWRALRASKNRFNLCERIENGKNLKALLDDDENTGPLQTTVAAAAALSPDNGGIAASEE